MIDHPVDRAHDRCPQCDGKKWIDCDTCGNLKGGRPAAMILLIGSAAWFGCLLIFAAALYRSVQ